MSEEDRQSIAAAIRAALDVLDATTDQPITEKEFFKLQSGETVVIDRGWLPIGNNTPGRPDSVPAPPQGPVTVVARLKPAEPELQRGAPDGQLASIDLSAYSAQLGYPLLERLTAQDS